MPKLSIQNGSPKNQRVSKVATPIFHVLSMTQNMWTFKTELCIFTLVGLLGLASHFSNPIAITITAVVDAMDGFVPRLADLIERPGLWFLTLIYCRKHKETKEWSRWDRRQRGCFSEAAAVLSV